MSVKTTIKMQGLNEAMQTLERLPERIVSRKGGPVKLALRKGARFIREKELERLRALLNESGRNESTGTLEKSIIASRGKQPANSRGERYVVRFRRRPYDPTPGQKKRVSTVMTAQIFEYGSEKQPPRSFIRATFLAHAQEAINIVRDDLLKRIDILTKKYGLDTDPDTSMTL